MVSNKRINVNKNRLSLSMLGESILCLSLSLSMSHSIFVWMSKRQAAVLTIPIQIQAYLCVLSHDEVEFRVSSRKLVMHSILSLSLSQWTNWFMAYLNYFEHQTQWLPWFFNVYPLSQLTSRNIIEMKQISVHQFCQRFSVSHSLGVYSLLLFCPLFAVSVTLLSL